MCNPPCKSQHGQGQRQGNEVTMTTSFLLAEALGMSHKRLVSLIKTRALPVSHSDYSVHFKRCSYTLEKGGKITLHLFPKGQGGKLATAYQITHEGFYAVLRGMEADLKPKEEGQLRQCYVKAFAQRPDAHALQTLRELAGGKPSRPLGDGRGDAATTHAPETITLPLLEYVGMLKEINALLRKNADLMISKPNLDAVNRDALAMLIGYLSDQNRQALAAYLEGFHASLDEAPENVRHLNNRKAG